jgi:DNA-3-methyladenine glycosylase
MACKRSSVRSRLAPVLRSPSSSGLGHRPFTAGTGVRVPLGTPTYLSGNWHIQDPLSQQSIIPMDFFSQSTAQVAKQLLGGLLLVRGKLFCVGETEAYVGESDPACHASCGPTQRNSVMYSSAGIAYVYLIYGMHHCLNVVTEAPGFPSAVLIRGGWLWQSGSWVSCFGLGRLTKALGICRLDNKRTFQQNDDWMWYDRSTVPPFQCTPRIGIKVGLQHLWRYVVSDSWHP